MSFWVLNGDMEMVTAPPMSATPMSSRSWLAQVWVATMPLASRRRSTVSEGTPVTPNARRGMRSTLVSAAASPLTPTMCTAGSVPKNVCRSSRSPFRYAVVSPIECLRRLRRDARPAGASTSEA